MYYYEKLNFRIPEEHDGRGIVTGEEREIILKMHTDGKGYGYIKRMSGRGYNTIYRICDPDRYEVYKERARKRMAQKRGQRGRQEKILKNQQNRETLKKRIGLLRKILKDSLPKKIRPLPEGRTYKANTKKHANI